MSYYPSSANPSTGATGQQGPKGDAGPPGTAATVAVGTVTTGAAGSSAAVTNGGSSTAASLNFTIPRGDVGATGSQGIQGTSGGQGVQGNPGAAATVAVGTVTTGVAGSSVAITNGGSSSAASLNFTIPRGDTGAQGTAGTNGTNGSAGPNTVTTATTTNITGVLKGNGANVAAATSTDMQSAIGAGVYDASGAASTVSAALPTTKAAVAGSALLSYDSTTHTFTQGALTAAQVGALPSGTVLAATKTVVAGSPLLSYDATTGAFTQGALTAANVGAAGLGSNTFTAIQTFQKGYAESVSGSTAPATGATLSLTTPVQLVAPTGAITGVIMPVGTVAGQTQTVINNSAFSITFAAVGTSRVSDGVSDVIAANSSRTFIWSGAAWFPQK